MSRLSSLADYNTFYFNTENVLIIIIMLNLFLIYSIRLPILSVVALSFQFQISDFEKRDDCCNAENDIVFMASWLIGYFTRRPRLTFRLMVLVSVMLLALTEPVSNALVRLAYLYVWTFHPQSTSSAAEIKLPQNVSNFETIIFLSAISFISF